MFFSEIIFCMVFVPIVSGNAGLRIFYSSKLRENEVGKIFLGHRNTPLLSIPPLQKRFNIYGFCSSECTKMVKILCWLQSFCGPCV